MRYVNCTPLPTGWDWAAKSLDFLAPDPLIRGVHRGDPVAIPTVASAKAGILAKTKRDKITDVRKDTNTGAIELPPEVKRKKNADPSALTCNQAGLAPSPLDAAGLEAGGSLHLDSLLPRGGTFQMVPSSKGVDNALPSGASSKDGSPKERPVAVFRGDHWRGLRNPRPRPEAPVMDSNGESPAAPSSWPSGWKGRCEYKE